MSRASKNVYHPHGDADDFKTVEDTLDSLDDRVTQNESDIATAQSDVSTLQTDLATAQSDISDLQGHGDTFSIAYPDNGTENVLINAPFGFTITSITSKCGTGTCTATFKIGSTALGGGANSVSTTEQTKTHSSDNVVAVGDDLTCTISSNLSCEKAIFTIAYTRT